MQKRMLQWAQEFAAEDGSHLEQLTKTNVFFSEKVVSTPFPSVLDCLDQIACDLEYLASEEVQQMIDATDFHCARVSKYQMYATYDFSGDAIGILWNIDPTERTVCVQAYIRN